MHRSYKIWYLRHGVVMEGNRKMRGCLKTFGWHCIIKKDYLGGKGQEGGGG